MAFNIADLIEHAVDVVPDRIALETDGATQTYAELESRANALAHKLFDLGVQPSDKVGLYSRNTIAAVESMVAIFKARAVMVNVNFRYIEAELIHICTDSDMTVLIAERRYLEKVANILPSVPKLREIIVIDDESDFDFSQLDFAGRGVHLFDEIIETSSPLRDFDERSADDIYMLYTGGTTGFPKGVMWRQEDVWRVLGGGIEFGTGNVIDDEYKLSRDGAENGQLVRFPIPPFIHGGSQWAVFQSLFAGGKVVVYPEFSAHGTWEIVEKHKVNVLFITGDAMGRPMIDALYEKDYDVSSLVSVASSAALFSASVKDQYLEKFPHAVIVDAIGSSETGFSGMGFASKGSTHTSGPRVTADKSAIVIREDGSRIEPGSDEIGMLARTGHIPLGYYNDPEKTANTFKIFDGVRHSIPGDYARIEADGSITMLGRGSVSINSGGEKIFPEEVEAALKSHPDVFDTVVVGVPDDRFGSRVAAVIATRDGKKIPLSSINEAARKEIAGYKTPRSVWFVDQIKRSPAGKPDYRWGVEITESRPADEAQEIIGK